MTSIKTYDYFFSYKSDDIELIRKVYDRLRSKDYLIWMNEYNIKHSEQKQFQKRINQGIDESDFGVLFITPRYADSPYCLVEIERLMRKLPLNKIIVIKIGDSGNFTNLFPELKENIISLDYNFDSVYKFLFQKKQKEQNTSKTFHPYKASTDYIIIESGFKFNTYNLSIDIGSRFFHVKKNELNPATKSRKEDYSVFSSVDRKTQLVFDYDYYESEFSQIVQSKQNDQEQIRVLSDDENDRKRLIDEMEGFEIEVKIALSRLIESNVISPTLIDEIEEVGVHMYSSWQDKIQYKHRMYSFRIPSLDKSCRVIKLVLPHPLLKKAFIVRFIFSQTGDQRDFFEYAPLYEKVVASFCWLKSDDEIEVLKQAKSMFKK